MKPHKETNLFVAGVDQGQLLELTCQFSDLNFARYSLIKMVGSLKTRVGAAEIMLLLQKSEIYILNDLVKNRRRGREE